MNCKDFLSLQSEYIDGTLHAEAAESMRMHLAECPACRRTHAEMKALLETLHTMDDIPVPEGLADEIIAAVLPAKKEKRVFGLPRFLRSWQTYSVAAACMLLVCVLFTQTHDRYLMTSKENTVDAPPAAVSETPPPDAAIKALPETESPGDAGAAHDAARTTEDNNAAYAYSAATAAPSADLAAAPAPVEDTASAPAPESQPTRETATEAPEEASVRAFSRMLPETDTAADFAEDTVPEAAEMPAEASVPFMMAETPAYDPANQKSAVTSEADAAEEADAASAPTAGAARASGGAVSRITARPYSLVPSLIQERVTFAVGDPAAEAIFQSAKGRGAAAVEAALDNAGISFSTETGIDADYTAQYNALVSEANALAARIADGETGLEKQLLQVEAEMQKLRETCASPALYLSIS